MKWLNTILVKKGGVNMDSNTFIVVRGGFVNEVYTNIDNLKIKVLDFDTDFLEKKELEEKLNNIKANSYLAYQ